jgi:hypothetical protein
MKSLRNYINENLFEDKVDELEKKLEKVEKKADDAKKEDEKSEESIKDEKSFRDYAENKFKEVFGDELDEDEMKETIDGILKDYKKEADEGDWGTLIGVLNKSFGS